MKNAFYFLVGIIFFAGSIYFFLEKPAPSHIEPLGGRTEDERVMAGSGPSITFGTRDLFVEVVDTELEREQGLSGKERLEPNHGMLFVFENPQIPGFWMKDMKFDLDIVWISKDWEVVGVERGAKATSYPQIYSPLEPILYVLEIPSGSAAEMGLDIGSKLSFNP